MAKKTAVVDLGSNSIRMVIFEKTSRIWFLYNLRIQTQSKTWRKCLQ